MKTRIIYARDEESAQDYMTEFFLDHDHIFDGTCNCGCGVSRSCDYYDGVNGRPDIRVIICESCYLSSALIDRV